MFREAAYYMRMALGVWKLVRTPLPPNLEGAIRKQLENREALFLDTVRRVIFADPANPYCRMFQLAGYSFEDLAASVKRNGLEGALAEIHRQGVYLSHDEFKGKIPIVRSGRHIPSSPQSFRNPLAHGLMEFSSSGSRSRGTPTRQTAAEEMHRQGYEVLRTREFNMNEGVIVELKPILPSAFGLNPSLRARKLGHRVDRWFALGGDWRDSGHYRVATQAMMLFGNLLGARAPMPTYLPPNDFSPVAEWVAKRRAEGVPCTVKAYVSPAVRVAAAAIEKGLDIRGARFIVGGEALTDAKRAVFERTGAEVFSTYYIHELGTLGFACRRMRTGNSVHLFHDSVAAINYRKRAPLTDVEVDSILFTTLLPQASRILINVEMDDSGVIEPIDCDCTFASSGFNFQIRDIASYGKLTGLGMTLVGTEIVRILEEALPASFGGAPGDYQLVEREGEGQTELVLRVSPRVAAADADAVKNRFFGEVRRCYGGTLAARACGVMPKP